MISDEIQKVEAFQTEDGTYHSSVEMAQQYLANMRLCEILEDNGGDPQCIVNRLSSNMKAVAEWINACRALERRVLGLEPEPPVK